MLLSQKPPQWSAQVDSSFTSNYDRQQRFDRGTKNPEGKFREALHNRLP